MPSLFKKSSKPPLELLNAPSTPEKGRKLLSAPLKRSASSPASPKALDTTFGAQVETSIELKYGWWPVLTEKILDIPQVEAIVGLCATNIRARGLELPFLFSSNALDINLESVCGLIRAYFSQPSWFYQSVAHASPHDLIALCKYALGRLTNAQGRHGFLSFDLYDKWRAAEKEVKYPQRFITTHLLSRLPSSTSNLLSHLLGLFSSAIAYTTANGTTPRKLAGLFSSFVFGLPHDESFDNTYMAWIRQTNALEHLTLAFIRSQTDQIGQLPTKLLAFVKTYPADLPANINTIQSPGSSIQFSEAVRIAKTVRFFSADLIQSAPTWDVSRSRAWSDLSPAIRDPRLSGSTLVNPCPAYSSSYRHLLNIRQVSDDSEESTSPTEYQTYRSTVEKNWQGFLQDGFRAEDKTRLKFDLNESERQARRLRHTTMDWNSFENSGFSNRETYLPQDLDFDVAPSVSSFPEEQKVVANKLRKLEKQLPNFNYDTIPHEKKPVVIDELFVEAWADVLVCSGWTREDAKESNFIVCQFRSQPQPGQLSSPVTQGDGRSAERFFIIEELIPFGYMQQTVDGKTSKSKKISFLRTVTRRKAKEAPSEKASSLSMSLPPSAKRESSDAFIPSGSTTKYISLSREPMQPTTPAMLPTQTPLPSRSASLQSNRRAASQPAALNLAAQPSIAEADENVESAQPSPTPSQLSARRRSFFKTIGNLQGRRRQPEDVSPHYNIETASVSDAADSPVDDLGRLPQSMPKDWVDVMVRSNARRDNQRDEARPRAASSSSEHSKASVIAARGSAVPVVRISASVQDEAPPLPDKSKQQEALADAYDGVEEDSDAEENEEQVWRGSRYEIHGQPGQYQLPTPIDFPEESILPRLPEKSEPAASPEPAETPSAAERSLRVSRLVEMYSKKPSELPVRSNALRP